MELDTNNHSVFLLYYHLVLVTKYRRQVIDDEISDYAKTTFERISESYHITLVEWNHDKDHVHIMFKAQPKTELTKFINAYKSASSRLIKRDFPRVKQFLWKEMFWSKSFCLFNRIRQKSPILYRWVMNAVRYEGYRW
ncbi:IS200/IS605 family transposase [Enterococcus faecium]|uniref:IS200/IS605 family transposase n=1 Tax=Enterococcus faecium TaxID=1352 RepID=UPI001F38D12A|nr:IS200/IS605 family transposase [Enterococcus faecium]